MPLTLLHVDSSPMGESSISRHLSAEFVKNWQAAHPDGTVITRDLTTTVIPPVSAAMVGAIYTPPPSRTTEQAALLAQSDELIAELQAAGEYVFGVPMHNFNIPSALKLWIDAVVRAGVTFSYATGAPVGLLTGKKAHVMIAGGGRYDKGTAMESINFAEPYLRHMLGFIGVTDVNFLTAGGTLSIRGDRETFLQPHIDAIRGKFAA